MQNWKRTIILSLFGILWFCKPIPFENVIRNQSVSQEVLVLRAGGRDSTEANFVPPNTGSRTSTSSGQQNPQTKPQKDQTNGNIGQKLTYKQPGDPGGLGAGNIDEDLPEIPDAENTISDPEFWNTLLGEETEDESTPATPPTKKLTQQSLKQNDSVTEIIQPREFYDWEGKKRVVKSKELKNATFSHGFEAKTSGPENLVECPIQPDPNKFQRENCSRVTDETVQNLWDKIFDITTAKSTKIGRVKFKTKMPYFDSETAVGYMDIITGDCFFYHENGKFWGYKKYSRGDIPDLLADVGSSLKWASDISSPGSEL